MQAAQMPTWLGAAWGPRRESPAECAARLSACMRGLASCTELFRAWYHPADREADARRDLVEPDPESLSELILAGASKRDSDGAVMEELGFTTGLWNGDFERPVGLMVSCGGWTSAPGLMNSFSLTLPAFGAGTAALRELGTALAIMRAVVEAWEPDWATCTSSRLRDAVEPGPRAPIVGWITFLAARRVVPEDLPVTARYALPGLGTILVAGERPQEVDAATLRAIVDSLQPVGSLAPTPWVIHS